MKMSALGEAFSVRIRVCSSPAAASGNSSTSMPGTAFLKASMKALLVDSLRAEYTEILPEAARTGCALKPPSAPPNMATPMPPGARRRTSRRRRWEGRCEGLSSVGDIEALGFILALLQSSVELVLRKCRRYCATVLSGVHLRSSLACDELDSLVKLPTLGAE